MNGIVQTFLKYAATGIVNAAGLKPPENFSPDMPGELAKVEELSAAMLDIKAADIRNAIDAADAGEVADQAAIAASILDSRDIGVASHWDTRRNAVLGCDWDVKAIDPADDGKALEMRKALDKAGVKNLISTLCDAPYFGYAGSLVEWENDAPSKFIPVHPTRHRFDLGGFPAVNLSTSGAYTPVAEMEPGRIVHMSCGSLPQKAGICRGLMWIWLFKRDCLLHRARYIERFGSPIISAKVTEAQWKDKTSLNSLLSRLREAVARGVAIYPEGATLELVRDAAGSSQGDFGSFIAELDAMITIRILGQTATSGDAGGLSKGQAQENVRRDILASDCLRIMDAVKRMLIIPMARFMFNGKLDDAFEFVIEYEQDEDLNQKALMVKTLSEAGYPADDDWVSETFGIPLKEKPPPPPAAPLPQMLPMDDSAIAGDETATRITEEALRRMLSSPSAIEAMRNPLREAITEVFSGVSMDDENLPAVFAARAHDLFSRFPALYKAMGASSQMFEDVFRGAMLTAMAKT